MAARLNKRHQASVRDKIRASQLINRLQDHALGKVDLKNTQVRAAEYLVDQCIGAPPTKVEHSGEVVTRLIIDG